MLRASSISLIVATSLALSICLQPNQARPNQNSPLTKTPVLIAKDTDAKKSEKDASTKDAKPSKDKKDSDAKDSKEAKDTKDTKDSKDSSKDAKDASKDSKDKAAAKPEPKEEPEKEIVLTNVNAVSCDQLIEKPKEYLGKNIRFTADFAGFCTLALNYKPALRPNKTHISFLVRKTDSKIPLSELKLALPIPKETDKVKNKLLTSLKDGDKLEVTGKVFSTALDEPWIDVVAIKRLSEAKKAEGDESSEEEE